MVINGLPLPGDLVGLIESGRWQMSPDQARVDRLFPENGGLCLYAPEVMESETRWFCDPRLHGHGSLGLPDAELPPGDLDPLRAVLIADLGHGFDQPFALDYRASRDKPPVLTLQWTDGGRRNRWILVAPHIRSFAELVGL